jgi:hypothetical protein
MFSLSGLPCNRIDENGKLEDFLNQCEHHSNINLYDQNLNDNHMQTVAQLAIKKLNYFHWCINSCLYIEE